MAATGDAEIQDGTKPARGRVLSERFQSSLIPQMLMISSGEQYRDAPARGPGRGSAPLGSRYGVVWSPAAFPCHSPLPKHPGCPHPFPWDPPELGTWVWRQPHLSLPATQDEICKGSNLPVERSGGRPKGCHEFIRQFLHGRLRLGALGSV